MDTLYIYIIGCSVVALAVALMIAVKLKYGFWYYQPVYHSYNLNYMFYRGVIQKEDPEPTKNKFYNSEIVFQNMQNIIQGSTDKTEDPRIQQIIQFIHTEYCNTNGQHFAPTAQQFIPYFKGHHHPCYISVLYEKELLQDIKHNDIIDRRRIRAIFTGRPLHVQIFHPRNPDEFSVHYADYLCVARMDRKKGTAPQMIQTHEYEQRRATPAIQVSLFKKEGRLNHGIVPLTTYPIYCFMCKGWKKPAPLTPPYKVLAVHAQNYRFLREFINRVVPARMDVCVMPDLANILELLQTQNLFFYVLMRGDNIGGAYFFKNTAMIFSTDVNGDGKTALMCIGSLWDPAIVSADLFLSGFKNAFWDILQQGQKGKQHNFGYCAMENMSDNGPLIENIRKKSRPVFQTPGAFYFYNYAYPTIRSNKLFILY